MIRATTIRRIARFGGVCLLLSLVVVIAVAKAQAATRHIAVVAIEPKGGATVDKEPFPTEAMPAGPGYVLKQPDQATRWEISAYVFMPSQEDVLNAVGRGPGGKKKIIRPFLPSCDQRIGPKAEACRRLCWPHIPVIPYA
jgi:hypothetical protein